MKRKFPCSICQLQSIKKEVNPDGEGGEENVVETRIHGGKEDRLWIKFRIVCDSPQT